MVYARPRVVPSACNNCRARKVRCDKKVPCSSCETAGISCQSENLEPSTSSKRSHDGQLKHVARSTQVSADAKDHLKTIAQRLDNIEGNIHLLLPHARSTQFISEPTYTPTIRLTSATCTSYGGESSFGTQSLHARDIARKAAMSSTATSPNVQVESALEDLQSVLSTPCTENAPNRSHVCADGERCIEVDPRQIRPSSSNLPVEIAMLLFRHFQATVAGEGSPAFLTFPLRNRTLLSIYCQRVYFSESLPTPGDLIVVHGLFYFLVQELQSKRIELLSEAQYDAYLRLCAKVLHDGVLSVPVLTQASHEHIEGLLLGILKAHASSDRDLCAILVSAASRHCLTLGYNRAKTRNLVNSEATARQNELFWMIYVFDKNFALDLGRPPNIPDNDIDADLPTVSANPRLRPWDLASIAYITLARIQGHIFDDLYSVCSLKESLSTRTATVEALANALHQWRRDFSQIDSTQAQHRDFFISSNGSSDAVVFALLAVVYRALSLTDNEFHLDSRCYSSARSCLEEHVKYLRHCTTDTSGIFSGYVNGVVLWASFTPFVVVFIHAVLFGSQEDIDLLFCISHAITDELPSSSSATKTLFRRCQAFARLADALISAQVVSRTDFRAVSQVEGGKDDEGASTVTLGQDMDLAWSQTARTETLRWRGTPKKDDVGSGTSMPGAAPSTTFSDQEAPQPSWYDIPSNVFRHWTENQRPMLEVFDPCFDWTEFDMSELKV